jgi:hypothetical protein
MSVLMAFLSVLSLEQDGARLSDPHACPPMDSQLYYYDDGTPNWLSWSGQWRGVWFEMEDFGGAGNSLICDYSEFWFYHHASYGWDTALFYAELWSGGISGPETDISLTTVVAQHYTACLAYNDPPVDVGSSFWVLDESAFSSGGWPCILGDGSPQESENHSFFSDDFEIWEPWIIDGAYANDYLIRAHGSFLGLDESTWGAIKTLF